MFQQVVEVKNFEKRAATSHHGSHTLTGSMVLPGLATYPGAAKEKLEKPTANLPDGRAMPSVRLLKLSTLPHSHFIGH